MSLHARTKSVETPRAAFLGASLVALAVAFAAFPAGAEEQTSTQLAALEVATAPAGEPVENKTLDGAEPNEATRALGEELDIALRGSLSPTHHANGETAGERTASLHDMLHRTVVHDRASRDAEISDIALRHTDKPFFSSNPVSFHRMPPESTGDLDRAAPAKAVFKKGDEHQPFDQLVTIVDLSEQRVRVYVEGELKHTWKVSTGRAGKRTPPGEWRPYRMHTMWHSRQYNMAPMPHSVFFNGGIAFHATGATGRLGRTASAGCVRLHPRNARTLFNLVKQYKMAGTIVRVVR
jgi:hypothetical protein